EQQWAIGQPASGRILQVSEGFGYRHSFRPSQSVLGGQYVCPGSATVDGVPVEAGGDYRVTMNSFLASGGDGFGVFNLGRDALGGEVDVDAFTDYFAERSPVAPGARDRIVQVAACG
ncbi:MAG TPA: 5'-nucleotidase C-terminal domain-containing protein, partial [Thauera sp.]|nr:5'-nucleotidase C-terminal domain-containing protein [Thauera sp.]